MPEITVDTNRSKCRSRSLGRPRPPPSSSTTKSCRADRSIRIASIMSSGGRSKPEIPRRSSSSMPTATTQARMRPTLGMSSAVLCSEQAVAELKRDWQSDIRSLPLRVVPGIGHQSALAPIIRDPRVFSDRVGGVRIVRSGKVRTRAVSQSRQPVTTECQAAGRARATSATGLARAGRHGCPLRVGRARVPGFPD